MCAVKNGRRKMEDRHTVLHDLNIVFADELPKVSERATWGSLWFGVHRVLVLVSLSRYVCTYVVRRAHKTLAHIKGELKRLVCFSAPSCCDE